MTAPPGSELPHPAEYPDWRRTSANARLKARWNDRLAWSIVVAVVLHALVIVVWPSWQTEAMEEDEPELELTPLQLISLYEQMAGGRGVGASAVPVSDIPDSLPNEPDVRSGGETSELELASLSTEVRERLLRAGGLIPDVVERPPRSRTPIEEAAPEGGDSTNIEGEASSTPGLAELPEPGGLDLDRLSAVRPELALMSPSNWVLVRNPNDVERFMERTYRRGDLTRSDEGTVRVALWIDERGSVEWAEINESSGRPEMDEVALELFSEVVAFRPARDQGTPVSRTVVFSVRFPWY
ncbi:MAG: energy transducer TonB [Longimicrobiales bacterium]|nr:energy transducer TonB [Longimicrobiales bacterium]